MGKLEKFEIVKFGPYRFIGKSVYARAGMSCGQGNFCGYLWDNSKWVFEKLDELKEYATDETHDAAILTWEKYCDKTKLLGYTVGRFMKADTPVPTGDGWSAPYDMDYFDIPEIFVAKGWFDFKDDGTQESLIKKAIEEQGEFKHASWKFMAEVGNGMGYYIACEKNMNILDENV